MLFLYFSHFGVWSNKLAKIMFAKAIVILSVEMLNEKKHKLN